MGHLLCSLKARLTREGTAPGDGARVCDEALGVVHVLAKEGERRERREQQRNDAPKSSATCERAVGRRRTSAKAQANGAKEQGWADMHMRARACAGKWQPLSGHKNPVGKSRIIGPRRADMRGGQTRGAAGSAQLGPSPHSITATGGADHKVAASQRVQQGVGGGSTQRRQARQPSARSRWTPQTGPSAEHGKTTRPAKMMMSSSGVLRAHDCSSQLSLTQCCMIGDHV